MLFDRVSSILSDLGNELESIFKYHEDKIAILSIELDNEQKRNKKLKQLLYNFLEDDLNNE